MPEHPKIEGLSDAAFRLLVRVWCRCSVYLTDGYITEAWWKKQKASARKELVDNGLIEVVPPPNRGVIAHDYDQHQRTAEEVREFKEIKSKSGILGNHNRWHQGKKHDPSCAICVANGSQVLSLPRYPTDR